MQSIYRQMNSVSCTFRKILRFFTLKKEPYVLMRVYNPASSGKDCIDRVLDQYTNVRPGYLELRFIERLKKAVDSVRINKASLIICDDTPEKWEGWQEHHDRLISILSNAGFTAYRNLFFAGSCGSQCSSLALWQLRKAFLKINKKNRKAFAVLLDQDDELKRSACRRIKSRISSDAIVISRYRIAGDMQYDITADGGKKHNRACMKWHKHNYDILPDFTSIGWTKAWSYDAMQTFVGDLESYFQHDNTSAEQFFSSHRAYEDFLDYYILLKQRTKIRTCRIYISHIYHKHHDSITSSHRVEDFKITRKEMLLTLTRSCRLFSKDLIPNWERALESYLSVKIQDIEHILEELRSKATTGRHQSLRPILDQTSLGSFATELAGNTNDPVITAAVTGWRRHSALQARVKSPTKESSISEQYNLQKSPREKQLRRNRLSISISIFTYMLVITFIPWIIYLLRQLWASNPHIYFNLGAISIEAISIFAATAITFIVFLCQKRTDIKLKIDEEDNVKKLYFSEFHDLIRHLEANLKVAIQIRETLEETHLRPSEVHFENLKWPEASCLFSDKIAMIIDKSKVDDFTRLRLNLRNLNNSAEYMRSYCTSDNFNANTMTELLDWEISRMIGYYVNYLYLQEHQFSFASPKEIDEYLTYPSVKEKLVSLFMSAKTSPELKVSKYLKNYYADRREKRNVVFHSF